MLSKIRNTLYKFCKGDYNKAWDFGSGSWLLLADPGCSRLLLAAPGGSWQRLAAPGNLLGFWRTLVARRGPWLPLAAPGGAASGYCLPIAVPGLFWLLLAATCAPWQPMVTIVFQIRFLIKWFEKYDKEYENDHV